jgi:hypothetical protein
VAARIREVAETCPNAEHQVAGGLAAMLEDDGGLNGPHP